MFKLSSIIRSIWLVVVLMLLGFGSSTVASAISLDVVSFAYDEQNQTRAVYDPDFSSICNYDSAPTLTARAEVNPTAGANSFFGESGEFLAAENVAGRGYQSFSAFRRAEGIAGEGQAWHHIVEQTPSNVERFGTETIHNTENLVQLPTYGALNGVGGLDLFSYSYPLNNFGLVADYFGNVLGSVSGTQVNWNSTRVSSYGLVPGYQSRSLSPNVSLSDATTWRGRRVDETGFIYLGARYYEPTAGRFLSSDPLEVRCQ